MKINELTGLYVGYNSKEDFKILVAANSEEEAQELANTYGKDSSLEGEFEIIDLINTTSSDNNYDCDYVIVNQEQAASTGNKESKDSSILTIEEFEKEFNYLLHSGRGKEKGLEHLLKIAKSMKEKL